MIKDLFRNLIPKSALEYARDVQRKRRQAYVRSLPLLSVDDFRDILRNRLGLRKGDLVFVHSSMDRLNLSFPFFQSLSLLREAVGDDGTLIFPTYPKLTSYKFLLSGEVFDVRKTPSYTGVLTEFARRQRGGVRSLHPTKSVVAIGPLADSITSTHQNSPYPYDVNSPYFKVIEYGGKAIGLGVATTNLSLVHSVDDNLKDEFPVWPYHNRLFNARCIDYRGREVTVSTYAHDMRKMGFDIPAFMAAHIPSSISEDLDIHGMRFFRVESARLFESMVKLARHGQTIYAKRFYR